MITFNRMTITAACAVLADYASHGQLALLESEWGISGRTSTTSKAQRPADLARIATEESLEVLTELGTMPLSNAIIHEALKAPPNKQTSDHWRKMVAGLRFDGLEVSSVETQVTDANAWSSPTIKTETVLRPIYSQDIPALNFREAEDEVSALLQKHGLSISHGHLRQAILAFTQGQWASANAQLRTFFESYFQDIAKALGLASHEDARTTRKLLGEISPPFLLSELNEWNINDQKPQYFGGLMARMHPAGSHPGLSEEDDCTFRLHITLISARLLLRRFDQRKAG
jgi:hypothetical protein